jgi:hypothetical protein
VSEDLGSVTKSEGFRVACLSRRRFDDRDERGSSKLRQSGYGGNNATVVRQL